MNKNVFCKNGLAVLCCLFLFAGTAFAQLQQTVTFFVKADSTWTVPTELNGSPISVTSVTFDAIGGGGAGGYVYMDQGGEAASGGGGGGAFATNTVSNPEGQFIIHAGKGGTNVGSTRTMTHGGASYVQRPNEDGFVVSAAGGNSVECYNHGTLSTNYYNFDGGEGGKAENCIPQTGASNGSNGGQGWYGKLWDGLLEVLHTQAGDGGAAGGNDGNICGGTTSGGDRIAYFLSNSYPGIRGSQYGGGGTGAQGYFVRINFISDPKFADGGAGYDGVVRVTYTYEAEASATAEDANANVCSSVEYSIPLDITLENVTPEEVDLTVAVVSNWDLAISGPECVYENGQFLMKGTMFNLTDHSVTHSVQYIVEYDGTELANAYVHFNVYAPLVAGEITTDSEGECEDQDVITLTMGDPVGGSGVYSFAWLLNGTAIENANEQFYSASASGAYKGIVIDDQCGATDTTEAVTVDASNSFDPGSIGEEDVEVCPNESYTTTLSANPQSAPSVITVTYYYKWEKKVDDGEWTNTDSVFKNYTVQLNPEDFNESVSYRYWVKANDCGYVLCNDEFTVSKMQFTDNTGEFEDLDITLDYGVCSIIPAELPIPELPEGMILVVLAEGQEDMQLTPSEEAYPIIWNVMDAECGAMTPYTQNVMVNFPECEGFTDVNGNDYDAVRIGCDCWITTNLRTKAGQADFYENNNEYENYGRLYTFDEAMSAAQGEAVGAPKVNAQGLCPEGWAIPTLEQFNNMVTAAQGIDNVKATEGWLSDKLGTGESGFDAMGAGMYDALATQYQRMLAYAGFWTSDENSNSTMGTVFEITYGCDVATSTNQKKENRLSVRCVRVNVPEE